MTHPLPADRSTTTQPASARYTVRKALAMAGPWNLHRPGTGWRVMDGEREMVIIWNSNNPNARADSNRIVSALNTKGGN